MQLIIDLLGKIGPIAGAVDAVLLALIALFTLIPGEQPEAAIRKIADLVEKFSKKP